MDPHDKNNVGECGCERNNISIFGKLSIRQNVFSAKSPIVKMSVRQNDFRQNVRVAVTLFWPSRPSVCLYSVTSCCMFNPCTSLRRSVTLLFILYFCSSIRYDTIPYTIHHTIPYTIRHHTTPYDTIYHTPYTHTPIHPYTHTPIHHTPIHPTIQYNTIQYNTIQYNTIQYNTIQYNTIQYNNTIQ